jgi:hypothetical protein
MITNALKLVTEHKTSLWKSRCHLFIHVESHYKIFNCRESLLGWRFKANGRVSKSPYLRIKYVVLYIKLDNIPKCSSCSASEVARKRCSCSSNHIQYKDFREINMENCCAQRDFKTSRTYKLPGIPISQTLTNIMFSSRQQKGTMS